MQSPYAPLLGQPKIQDLHATVARDHNVVRFISRCTRPAACAAARPAATCVANSMAFGVGIAPAWITRRSVLPLTSSVTIQYVPLPRPIS